MFLLLFACAVLAGGALLAAGLRRMRNDSAATRWRQVEATVVGHAPSSLAFLPARWRDRVRAPRVAWTDDDGTQHEATCLDAYDGREALRGSVVGILVDPRDPKRVRIDGRADLPMLAAALLLAIGAMTLLFGLAGLGLALAFR